MSHDRRLERLSQAIDQTQIGSEGSLPEVANIIDFCIRVLGFTPYPAQALVLKLMVGANGSGTSVRPNAGRFGRLCSCSAVAPARAS